MVKYVKVNKPFLEGYMGKKDYNFAKRSGFIVVKSYIRKGKKVRSYKRRRPKR